jgi:hypothetical protein
VEIISRQPFNAVEETDVLIEQVQYENFYRKRSDVFWAHTFL